MYNLFTLHIYDLTVTVINKLYFQDLWQFIIKNNWTLEITSSIVICFSLVQDIFMVEGEWDQGAATINSLLPITSFLKLNWLSHCSLVILFQWVSKLPYKAL